MRISAAIILPLLALAALASGCSDSGGGKSTAVVNTSESTAAAATASAENFDPNVFTAIGLQPSDVPGDVQLQASFATQYNGDVIAYTANYTDAHFSIESTIAHGTPGGSIDDAILRLRSVAGRLIKGERNYTIDGAEQAFSYSFPDTFSLATLVIKDGYYVNIVVNTDHQNPASDPGSQDSISRYTKTAFDRLKAYLADPSSVTPVPGTPRYATPTASP